MNIVLISLLLSTVQYSFAGGVCSQNQINPLPRNRSFSSAPVRTVTDINKIKREKQIRYAVSEIALPVIYMLHSNVNYNNYGYLNMNHDDLMMFKDAVSERYNDNIVEIGHIISESIERHRQHVHRVAVHQKNINRRRRLAWRSEDRAKFAAFIPKIEPIEEKEESK